MHLSLALGALAFPGPSEAEVQRQAKRLSADVDVVCVRDSSALPYTQFHVYKHLTFAQFSLSARQSARAARGERGGGGGAVVSQGRRTKWRQRGNY